MDDWVDVATLVAALACGLMAGVWFAFSGFVMQALQRLPAEQGIAAMQSVNVTAVRAPLMIGMFGAALLCLALGVVAVPDLSGGRAPWLLAGAVAYLLGTIVVTIAGNIPLNDAITALDPSSGEAHRDWERHAEVWTNWNTVRCVTSLAAAALLTVGLVKD